MTDPSEFLAAHPRAVLVRLVRVRGSSPREAGAEMIVAPGAMWGTIGGGQLEFMALDRARALLDSGDASAEMDVPLGPDIGQCCGGRVEIALRLMDDAARAAAIRRHRTARGTDPAVLIFGAGHVGRALARALLPLPLRTALIDSRPQELERAARGIDTRLTPLPEAELRSAPSGAAYLVMTHDHGLDFLIAAEALARGDAAYVGMIGSATKRASFRSWAASHAPAADVSALVCPIGALGRPDRPGDKRPDVIAALVAAELVSCLLTPA